MHTSESEHLKKQGENNVSRVRWLGRKGHVRGDYASREEFAKAFASERAGLHMLALSLTGDSEAARRCLISTFRECLASSSVSRDWVLRWTRRMVIRHAISFVMGPGNQSFVDKKDDVKHGLIGFSPDDSPGTFVESGSILDLPELDRFVFVICVLERYSMYDCALLLGKSPRDVIEARERVGIQVGQMGELGEFSRFVKMR